MPKSPILIFPLLERKKLPDFRSLCKMCMSWMYFSARIA